MGRSAYSSDFKVYLICYRLRTMINQRITTNGESVIYVGGGNFFTQAKPTNFHQFWPQKILLENETVADFKEVTAAERSAIETADAKWTRPPQSFIDLWNNACIDPLTKRAVGRYNEATGYFELNGLTDITYAQAMEIMSSASYWCRTPIDSMPSMSLLNIRTAFPFGGYGNSLGAVALNSTFKNCEKLEAVVVQGGNFASLNGTFAGCKKLRKVALNTSYTTSFDNAAFYQCYALEELSVLPQILSNINLSPCSRLSVASASNITAKGKSGITVTVHADTFAKLTGDTTNPAVAALTPSELAQWQQTLTAATAKNISFTTP